MPTDTSTTTPNLLQSAIAAAKTGQSQKARDLLMQVLETDERNIKAWIWMSSVVDDPEERQICLENVLAIDPNNQMAQKGLSLLQTPTPTPPPVVKPAPANIVKPSPPPAKPIPTNVVKPSPSPAKPTPTKSTKYRRLDKSQTASTPSSPQRNTPSKASEEMAPTPAEPLLDVSTVPSDNPLDNEYACPYCATPTQADDKRCGQCRQSLWLREPKLDKPSTFFKILLFLQILNTLGAGLQIIGAVALLFIESPFGETPWLSVAILPALLLPAFFNIFLLIGLFKRWRFVFYLYLLQAVLAVGVVGAGIAVIGTQSLTTLVACGVPLGLLVISQLFLIFNLGDDFTFDEKRILLEVDPDDLGAELMVKGQQHAKKKMWALAAFHFRQAGRRLGDKVEPQLSLAVAYNNLKLSDYMAEPVRRAQEIKPTDPRVKQLVRMLQQQGN